MNLIFRTFSALAIITSLSCASKNDVNSHKKVNLILITGSHLDETSWSDVAKNLDETHFSVLALPRLGRDANQPLHLKQIAEMACHKLEGPTAVVAHSFGGATANEMTGVCPEKISKIIYIAALVPLNGEHPTDQLKGADQKLYMSIVEVGKDRITPKSKVKFLNGMDSEVSKNQDALPAVFPESMLNLGDVIEFKNDTFNAIPKYYVFTSKDHVIAPEFQKKIAQRITLTASEMIQSGHLPLLSKPKEVAEIIKAVTSLPESNLYNP